jgi:hypothetical protein
MRYDEYSYLFPPRPETKIAVPMLGFYEKRGYWAQTKKNGTCTLIFARGNDVIFKTRHPEVKNGEHSMWKPEGDHNAFFAGSAKFNVFVVELLHSKVTDGPKNELFIFDQIVANGVQLVGTTFAERQQLLHDQFGGDDEGDQVRIAPRITLAKCFDENFAARFQNLKAEDEGLVLKDPSGVLKPCFKIDSNKAWQVKCRIAHKNYSFSIAFWLNSLITVLAASTQWADSFTSGMI